MENVDEIIIRYYKALLQFSALIDEKAQGDWSKAELIIQNVDGAKQLIDEIDQSFYDFEHSTSAGKLYQVSDELNALFNNMSINLSNYGSKASITTWLEHMYDDWSWKTEEGHVEDYGIVQALRLVFLLPSFNPDEWLRRRFLIRGVRISSDLIHMPKTIETRFNEACTCFIYGQNLATYALARAVLEVALKEKYIVFSSRSMTLGNIINKGWHKIDQLKRYPELRKKAEKIWLAGNDALHMHNDYKVQHLINEFVAISVLENLKELLEHLYG